MSLPLSKSPVFYAILNEVRRVLASRCENESYLDQSYPEIYEELGTQTLVNVMFDWLATAGMDSDVDTLLAISYMQSFLSNAVVAIYDRIVELVAGALYTGTKSATLVMRTGARDPFGVDDVFESSQAAADGVLDVTLHQNLYLHRYEMERSAARYLTQVVPGFVAIEVLDFADMYMWSMYLKIDLSAYIECVFSE